MDDRFSDLSDDDSSGDEPESSVVLVDRKFSSFLSWIRSNDYDSSSDDSSNEISDLPPIVEDSKISSDEEKCQPIGCIKSFNYTLGKYRLWTSVCSVLESYNSYTVLFVDRGREALGRVSDVFGSVNKSYYAVRFNDSHDIKELDINIKEPVYCAPQTVNSHIVLVSELMKMQGSDASWRHKYAPRPSKPLINSQDLRYYFPTYAQQFSSMEYSYAYLLPYSPMPRHGSSYPPPRTLFD